MPQKPRTKTLYVELNANKEGFVTRFIGSTKEHDFSDISLLRKLLSNEKSRILHLLKHRKPRSIYSLAKLLGRDFRSVKNDLKFLERFGFISFYAEKRGGRTCIKPTLNIERLEIQVNV